MGVYLATVTNKDLLGLSLKQLVPWPNGTMLASQAGNPGSKPAQASFFFVLIFFFFSLDILFLFIFHAGAPHCM